MGWIFLQENWLPLRLVFFFFSCLSFTEVKVTSGSEVAGKTGKIVLYLHDQVSRVRLSLFISWFWGFCCLQTYMAPPKNGGIATRAGCLWQIGVGCSGYEGRFGVAASQELSIRI